MPINNFKPFSFAVGARVLSQVSWENDTGILQGFSSGILTKERLNKALRQPSAITAALAEVVGTRINEDMLDNGDFPRLVRQIDAAFAAAGGGGGGSGGSTQSLQLKTTGIAFVFENATSNVSSSPTITFTVEMVGFTGAVTYTAQARDASGAVLGTFALGGVPPVATMTAAQFLTYPTTQYVVVTASVTLSTGVVLTETETIFKSVNGDGALQVRLTNQAATLPALADGTVISYATAYGTLEAYKGQTLLSNATTPSVSFSLVGYSGFSTTYPAAQAGISVNATTGAYVVSGGMTADAALVQIRCTFSGGGYQDAFFVLAKSRQGQPGANGTAPRVDLDATNQIFVTPSNSTTPNPSSVNITALVSNIPSPTYQWRIDGIVQANVSPVLTLPSFPAGGTQKVVRCDVTGSDSSTAFDSLSFYSIKDGDDAIRAGLDNETRTISCDAAGTPTAGLPINSQIVVVRGATVINNTDGVTYQLVSSTGFTGLSLSASGAIEITGITADVAEANYTITLNGNVYPAGKLIAVKSRDGASGSDPVLDTLTNSNASLPADSAGTVTSYANAVGTYRVTKGATTLTNATTPSVAFSVAGYTGFNTTYPAAQAGININAVTGEYAITAGMSLDSATVTFRATVSGGIVREKILTLTKQKAGSAGFQMSFTPRSEIGLLANTDGQVLSYSDAFTDVKITNGNTDDTSNWALSIASANVTASLAGARVSILALLGPGTPGSFSSGAYSYAAAGWERPGTLLYGNGVFVTLGFSNSALWQKIMTCPKNDFGNWSIVDTGISGRFYLGTFEKVTGAFVVVEGSTGSTNKTMRSVDGGATWSAAVTLPVSSQWSCIGEGNGTILVGSQISTTGCRSTDGGLTYGTITFPGTPSRVWAGAAAGVWFTKLSNDTTYRSVDNGNSWSAVNVAGWAGPPFAMMPYKGRIVVTFQTTTNLIASSSDNGATWTISTLPFNAVNALLLLTLGVLYCCDGNNCNYTTDGVKWKHAGAYAINVGTLYNQIDYEAAYLPALDYTSANWYKRELLSTADGDGSVTVTGTKAGQADLVKILPVRRLAGGQDLYIASAFPGQLTFPATLDGVVTSYQLNTITASIFKNGADDTSGWAFSWTTNIAGLTPSSGSSNVATFTNMASNVDAVLVKFRATKSGLPEQTGDIWVTKNKGTTNSGIQTAVYSAFSAVGTQVTLRFKPDGYYQIQQGSGSFVNAGVWHNPPASGIGTGFWILAENLGGHALTGMTLNTWLQLNVDRDLVLSDTNPGNYTTNIAISIATSNTGANGGRATGSMALRVP